MKKRNVILIGFFTILALGIVAILVITGTINGSNTVETASTENNSIVTDDSESTEVVEYTYESLRENSYIVVTDDSGHQIVHMPDCQIAKSVPFDKKGVIGGSSLKDILKYNPSYIKCDKCLGD